MKKQTKVGGAAVGMLTASMVIFGTIGVFRRYIPLGSATLAAVRGYIGVATILVILLFKRQKPDWKALRGQLWRLLLSGGFIGINWILLFEAYERTTVAVATLCYYMAPVLAILGAAVFLRERLTVKKLICVLVATLGMAGVAGVFGAGFDPAELGGVFYGLAAAVFYATVMLMNQKITGVSAFDKTVAQLLAAAVVVTPYALATESGETVTLTLTPGAVVLVLAVGVVHTGVAYALYFGAMGRVPTQTVAFLGYIDPVVAILLSVVWLGEPMGLFEILGTVCVLGATVVSEGAFPGRRDKAAEKSQADK